MEYSRRLYSCQASRIQRQQSSNAVTASECSSRRVWVVCSHYGRRYNLNPMLAFPLPDPQSDHRTSIYGVGSVVSIPGRLVVHSYLREWLQAILKPNIPEPVPVVPDRQHQRERNLGRRPPGVPSTPRQKFYFSNVRLAGKLTVRKMFTESIKNSFALEKGNCHRRQRDRSNMAIDVTVRQWRFAC